MAVTDAPTNDTPTRNLNEVAELCGSRSAEIEATGHLPRDLADALIDTGAFKTWVPSQYGGPDGTVTDLLDAIETVAYHDGSAGWCVMIAGTTGLNAGFLAPEWGDVIYNDPRSVTGGFGMPAGVATPVDGGLRVSGTWAWGSGTSHCTSIGGGARIVDADGAPTSLPDGTSMPFVFFDVDDVELLDTWHVSGLKGTGSTDYRVVDAFVPDGRWVDFSSRPAPISDHPLYRFSFFGALGLGVSSVLVALARRAIDELVLLGDKKPTGSSKSLSERPTIQSQLAEAEVAVRSSTAFVREVVDECWHAAATEGHMTDEQKRSLRLAANNAAERCAHAVDLCYHAGGGTSVYETSPLQRVFRDAHVATQHGMIAPRLLEPLGRMRFGLPTSAAQF